MDIDHYDNIERSADYKLYSFMSSGPKGDLEKVIKFTAFPEVADSSNLALGTKRGEVVDYEETTNNNDRDKIIATIFYITLIFSAAYPDQKIFIKGRNKVKRDYTGELSIMDMTE